MARYTFKKSEQAPGYVEVHDSFVGEVVTLLWEEAAMMACLMYHNMLNHHPERAEEFMYGYLLGKTHGALFSDKYPQVASRESLSNGERILIKMPEGLSNGGS